MKRKITRGIYKQMQKFADLTQTMISRGNISRAKKCFAIAENLFIHGNKETKTAISNVYLYSVSGMLELKHFNTENLLPNNLKKEYIKQINAF
ncbi:hypothetical protein ACFP1I_13545 [Dyadobacter subterraneus]|uniref:DUF7674 domain-containing protein n=1 Tax=Dyadobacter subterraneus TaxID=2773304 RepID=A0ABR9WA37_9BACT|nr:hypothetical protein [Dyadobacter subterraneus]MBE9462258.1 hypothetical protein [Dyadobacter subterraneus]